jgi:hypothetical protein
MNLALAHEQRTNLQTVCKRAVFGEKRQMFIVVLQHGSGRSAEI